VNHSGLRCCIGLFSVKYLRLDNLQRKKVFCFCVFVFAHSSGCSRPQYQHQFGSGEGLMVDGRHHNGGSACKMARSHGHTGSQSIGTGQSYNLPTSSRSHHLLTNWGRSFQHTNPWETHSDYGSTFRYSLQSQSQAAVHHIPTTEKEVQYLVDFFRLGR
jgi:hypothetical protein